MRFALGLDPGSWSRAGTAERTLELAERADAGGVDALWLTEDPDGWDAFAVLGAISQRTRQIHLCTGVVNPYHRNPNAIAASIATLERLAPGRAVLGLGRGQPEWYQHALGMEIGSPLERMRETIELLRQWEVSEVASVDGEIRVDRWIRKVRPTHPTPIVIAAVGPKALELAGRQANGVYFNMLATPEYLAGAIARVRAAAIAAGRDPGEIAFVANPSIQVTDNPAPILRSLKRFVATVLVLPGMEVLLENPELDVPAIMRAVRSAMKTREILQRGGGFTDLERAGDLDAALAAMPDALVERGSAVGSLEFVRDRIAAFEAVGVTELILATGGLPETPDGIRTLLAALRA